MKICSFTRRLFRFVLLLGLAAWVCQTQAQSRIELGSLSWFNSNNLAPGSYTMPGSPSETLVNTIPVGGPPAVFCNPVFGTSNNGQTMIGSGGKGAFETLNDYGGTFTVTRKYLVTPGRSTYMKVRMASIPQSWLLVSSISASIDGRSLGSADRYNTSWDNQTFFEASQLWTPSSSLVNFVISVTMPGGCSADELILYVDQFYQEASTIHAIDDAGMAVDSNGGQSLANVLANDLLGSATPTPSSVILTQISSTDPKVTLDTSTGAVNVAPATNPGSYSLVYQICERANPANCSQATVTLRVSLALATITVKKVLAGGGRFNPADQFTVQLKSQWNGSVDATGTTRGSGSTVDAGSGSTGAFAVYTADDGAVYVLGEVMAAGSVSALSRYSTTISCENKGVGGTDVGQIHSFTDVLSVNYGDTVICTITNSSPGANLRLKQVIAPGSGQPPFNFSYTVGNGWGSTAITNAATGAPGVWSETRVLTAGATSTPIAVTLPAGWRIVPETSACTDSNGASSGNGSNSFGSLTGNVLTVPAANVRIGAALECTVTLGLSAPAATLTVRHMVVSPMPPNINPPFTFSYTGNNESSAPALQITALSQYFSTAAIPLAATNTATTVFTSLPDARWFVASFNCLDTTAATSGNQAGNLATSRTTSVTIPAGSVLPGANLRCTMVMGHVTP